MWCLRGGKQLGEVGWEWKVHSCHDLGEKVNGMSEASKFSGGTRTTFRPKRNLSQLEVRVAEEIGKNLSDAWGVQ